MKYFKDQEVADSIVYKLGNAFGVILLTQFAYLKRNAIDVLKIAEPENIHTSLFARFPTFSSTSYPELLTSDCEKYGTYYKPLWEALTSMA